MNSNVTTQNARTRGKLLDVVAFDPREIGQRIAAARLRKGWTQLEFALTAKISPSSVARWEAGKLPPIRELVRIAEVLEIELEELVELPAELSENARLDRLEDRLEAAATAIEMTLLGLERGIQQILARLDAQDGQANPGS